MEGYKWTLMVCFLAVSISNVYSFWKNCQGNLKTKDNWSGILATAHFYKGVDSFDFDFVYAHSKFKLNVLLFNNELHSQLYGGINCTSIEELFEKYPKQIYRLDTTDYSSGCRENRTTKHPFLHCTFGQKHQVSETQIWHVGLTSCKKNASTTIYLQYNMNFSGEVKVACSGSRTLNNFNNFGLPILVMLISVILTQLEKYSS